MCRQLCHLFYLHSFRGVYTVVSRVEAIAVEIQETHQQARGRQIRALVQLEVIHVRHNQEHGAVRTYTA